MNDLEFKSQVLDKISSSFCGAKWLNATIWLNSGMTASCHHPRPHKIPLEEVKKDCRAIHNTEFKKEQRRLMQKGQRPAECEYCWKIEDLGASFISDRVFKSKIHQTAELQKMAQTPWQKNVGLKTVEIAFDRVCNFACSYCNPSFSSVWANDIKKSGPYRNLNTDPFTHYTSDHSTASPFAPGENPYIKAWWEWWPELSRELEELRITGGEPLLTPETWKILESVAETQLPIRIAINSNLGMSDKIVDRLCELSKKVPHLEIYTSNESTAELAEYVRDGLVWQDWSSNIDKLFVNSDVKKLHFMMTVSSLSVFGITDFLDFLMQLKERRQIPVFFSVNILRFPTFQSVLALPEDLRANLSQQISAWLEENSQHTLLDDFEKQSLQRLGEYLLKVDKPTETAASSKDLFNDLQRFIVQYDERRQKDFRKSLHGDLVTALGKAGLV